MGIDIYNIERIVKRVLRIQDFQVQTFLMELYLPMHFSREKKRRELIANFSDLIRKIDSCIVESAERQGMNSSDHILLAESIIDICILKHDKIKKISNAPIGLWGSLAKFNPIASFAKAGIEMGSFALMARAVQKSLIAYFEKRYLKYETNTAAIDGAVDMYKYSITEDIKKVVDFFD